MSITTYCKKNKSNLWTEYSKRLIFLFACQPLLCNNRETTREKVLFFLLWTWCHPVFTLKRDVVHRRSRLSLWIPWCHIQPIFASDQPDGCKAALLQNMSRAGEEEVGVEAGKGQRPKTSPYTSSRSRTLWHPNHAAGTLKQVVKPPPTKRANLLWNVFVYF